MLRSFHKYRKDQFRRMIVCTNFLLWVIVLRQNNCKDKVLKYFNQISSAFWHTCQIHLNCHNWPVFSNPLQSKHISKMICFVMFYNTADGWHNVTLPLYPTHMLLIHWQWGVLQAYTNANTHPNPNTNTYRKKTWQFATLSPTWVMGGAPYIVGPTRTTWITRMYCRSCHF